MTTQALPPDARMPAGAPVTFRGFRDFGDIPGMAAANQRLRRHVGRLEPVDVDAMANHYRHLVNCDLPIDCILVERDGVTAGYARVEWHDLEDGDRAYEQTIVVEPELWGHGVADRCIEWCEARLRQVSGEHPRDRRAWFANYSFGGDVELEQALDRHGYVPARWDATMLRPTLADLPAVQPLPPGYAIRPVPADRLHDVAATIRLAFREEWGNHADDESGTDEWLAGPQFDIGLVTVVWHDDAPVAVVSAQVQAHADGRPIGYVDAVATHPGHRRKGLARAALTETLHRLAARGLTRAYLGVDADNDNRAFELYEEAGFVRVTRGTSYRKPFGAQEDRR